MIHLNSVPFGFGVINFILLLLVHFVIRIEEREVYLLKQTSEHTCTGLGATSPGCGALAGSLSSWLFSASLNLKAALCLDLIKMMLKHLFYINKCCSTNLWYG